MNAIVANEGEDGPSLKQFRKDMNEVHGELLTASRNITYGDEEAKPILTMMTKLGEYERVVGQIKGQTKDAAIPTIQVANQIMRGALLPAAVELDKANFHHLTETYEAHRNAAFLAVLPFLGFAVLTLLGLGILQFSLYRKTSRVANPLLLVATAILVGFTAYGGYTLKSVESKLVSFKQDAFDSVHALWTAKAIAYDANAYESLYLIYDGHKDQQNAAIATFKGKAGLLLGEGPKGTEVDLKAGKRLPGLLGDELANITFPGEKEAALNTLNGWNDYRKIDTQITDLLQQGKYQEALVLDLGTKPGQSNWAFDRFDKALDATTKINQDSFDESVAGAFGSLDIFPYALAVSILGIVAACFFGMKPRLEEYRF